MKKTCFYFCTLSMLCACGRACGMESDALHERINQLDFYGVRIGTAGAELTRLSDSEESACADMENLIKTGCDVNVRDKYGRTVLVHALCCGHSKIAQLLRQYGAQE